MMTSMWPRPGAMEAGADQPGGRLCGFGVSVAQTCENSLGGQWDQKWCRGCVDIAREAERIDAAAEGLIRDLGVYGYSEARQREREASSIAMAREWNRVALGIARKTRRRVGFDTATRMASEAKLANFEGLRDWPERGVYFFFEPTEARVDSGSGPRVVRAGTHALGTGSRSSLRQRLRQHRGSRSGLGNLCFGVQNWV